MISTVRHESRRNYSYWYTLVNQAGLATEVCRTVFLGTLGYHPKNDGAIVAMMKNTPIDAITPAVDQRGKHDPHHKLCDEVIEIVEKHIETFYPCISHYRRETCSTTEIFIKRHNENCYVQGLSIEVPRCEVKFRKLQKNY